MNEKTCKDCLHYKVCQYHIDEETTMTTYECDDFADSSEWVNLPCKVGDTVHIIGEYRGLYEAKVRVFFVNENSVEMIRTTKCDIPIEELGKTLFLTKEEAEKALEERKEK